jgi:hypothetical protein
MTLMKRSALCVAFSLAALGTATWAQNAQILPTMSILAGTYKTNGYAGDGGLATSATFGANLSTANADPYGNIYVADASNNVVRKVDPTGVITTFAGGATAVCAAHLDAIGNGCAATQATLKNPQTARWYKGSLYIADTGNNEIRVVDGTNGNITAYLGTGTTPTTDGALATASGLNAPQDFTFDRAGNMYVMAAGGAPWIVRVDAQTKMTLKFAGTGKPSTTNDGQQASTAQINTPTGIATDSAGNVYLSLSASNSIRKVTLDAPNATTGIMSTYVGATNGTTATLCADGSTTNVQCLTTPERIMIDANGNLYIADAGTDFSVRKVVPNGTGNGVISSIAGIRLNTGTAVGLIPNQATLVLPFDAEYTPSGDMIISDRGAAVVYIARPAGTFSLTPIGTAAATQTIYALTQGASGNFTVAGNSDFTVSSTSCVASTTENAIGTLCSATLSFTPSAAGLRSGRVIFTDASNAIATTPLSGLGKGSAVSILPGTLATIAGTGTSGSTGDNAAALAATFTGPGATAVDGSGNVYVADSGSNTVRKFTPGGNMTLFAGTEGMAGYTGDGSAATSARLSNPSALALDGSGNVYIADTGNNAIRKVNAQTGLISTIAGGASSVCATAQNANGDACPATAALLSAPSGVAVSSAGTLYIADTGHNVIRYVQLRLGVIYTEAGTGAADTTGDGGLAIAAAFNAPKGLAIDSFGNLYVADTGNNRVREITAPGFVAGVAGVGGAAGYSPDGIASTISLSAPTSVAVDASGQLYIADSGNHRVGLVSGGNFITVAGTGSKAGSSDNALSTSGTLYGAKGVALDNAGNLYIADTGNNKVREVTVTGPTVTFPLTSPNASSSPIDLVAYNTGNQTLNVAALAFTGPYSQHPSGGTDCGASVMVTAASACQLQLVFSPTAPGSAPGSATLTDSAQGGSATTQKVTLAGTSSAVFVANFTTSLAANVTAGAAQSVTISVTSPGLIYTGTLTFTSSDHNATLPAPVTFTTADAGTKTITGIKFATAGAQTLTVTDAVTQPTVTATASTVVIPANASLTAVSGNNQSADIATGSYTALQTLVTDGSHNPIAGVNVTFTVVPASNGATATFAGGGMTQTVTTGSSGIASSPVLSPNTYSGTFTVTASAQGLSNATFTLTNTSSIPTTFVITPSATAYPTRLVSGQTVTESITISSQGGFAGTVNLACTAPQYSTCALSPTSFAITPTVSGTTTLTFSSTPPSTAGLLATRWTGLTLSLMLAVGAFAFRRRKLGAVALALLLSLGVTAMSGCGGHQQPTQVAGPYTVTLTGTSGSQTQTSTIVFFVAGT